jgi:5-methyltetrahydrofolate--homocysteine methyltransferase
MTPAASVSAVLFSHPESTYFAVGKMQKDQIEDYATRKKMDLSVVEKWMAPNLAYDTE